MVFISLSSTASSLSPSSLPPRPHPFFPPAFPLLPTVSPKGFLSTSASSFFPYSWLFYFHSFLSPLQPRTEQSSSLLHPMPLIDEKRAPNDLKLTTPINWIANWTWKIILQSKPFLWVEISPLSELLLVVDKNCEYQSLKLLTVPRRRRNKSQTTRIGS